MPAPRPAEIDPERVYSAREAALFFGVHSAQLYRWADASTSPRAFSRLKGRLAVVSRHPFRVRGDQITTFLTYRQSLAASHPGVIVMARSLNAKLGRAAATYVARQSCPTSCPFQSEGCYAEHDNTRTHWDRITAGSIGVSPLELARREAAMIDELPGDRDLRLHVAGDSTTVRGTKILAEACRRYGERGAALGLTVQVFAYTHAWRSVPRSAWGVVSILASCETAADVTLAHSRGYATALVVSEFQGEASHTPDGMDGVRIVPCPQQTRDRTCTDCRLCFSDRRLLRTRLTIGFALHGWGSNKARRALGRATRIALPLVA